MNGQIVLCKGVNDGAELEEVSGSWQTIYPTWKVFLWYLWD